LTRASGSFGRDWGQTHSGKQMTAVKPLDAAAKSEATNVTFESGVLQIGV